MIGSCSVSHQLEFYTVIIGYVERSVRLMEAKSSVSLDVRKKSGFLCRANEKFIYSYPEKDFGSTLKGFLDAPISYLVCVICVLSGVD